MTRSFSLRLGVLALSAVLLGGCAADSPVGFVGSWGSAEPGQPELTLAADGTVHGTDGCNRLTGSWEQQADTVYLSELAATLMLCPEVDDWLNDAASLTVDGDQLQVYGPDGEELGTLPRR